MGNQKSGNSKTLFNQWEQMWFGEAGKGQGKEGASVDDIKQKRQFYDMFAQAYDYINGKASKNKRDNFFWKGLVSMLITLSVPAILIVGWIVCHIFSLEHVLLNFFWDFENNRVYLPNCTVAAAVLVFTMFTILTGITKWIDTRKFQETWVRHENAKERLDMEMRKYVLGLEPYDENFSQTVRRERDHHFMLNVLEIFAENLEKFKNNMENKEISVRDSLDKLTSMIH